MFMRMFFIAWTVMHAYVAWRITTIPLIKRKISRRSVIITAAILWASFLLPRLLESMGVEAGGQSIELLTMDWLGIIFLMFVSFLAVDLVTGFGWFLPRAAAALRGWALVAGIVMAVVSDLHIGALRDGQWLEALVAQVNSLHPDLILLLGDIFEGDSDHERQTSMMSTLHSLSAPLGVWMVSGNHESHGGLDSGIRFFEDCGIQMLRNRWAILRPGLALGGIDDGGHRGPSVDITDRVKQTLAAKPDSCATIFLSSANASRGSRKCGRGYDAVWAHPRRTDRAIHLHLGTCESASGRQV